MSKNSFTENFNNCVKGFPVASIAAHMVLNEGLIGDALKLGIAGLGAYGLYNGINGDQNIFGNTIKNAGESAGKFISGLGNGNDTFSNIGSKITSGMSSAGESLNNALDKGRAWVQDLPVGKAFGLGGQKAAERQEIKAGVDEFNRVTSGAMQNQKNAIYQQHLTPEETQKKIGEIETQYANDAQKYGESKWRSSSRNDANRNKSTTDQQTTTTTTQTKQSSGMPSTPTAAPKPAAPSTLQVNKPQPAAKSSTTELTPA